MKKVKVIHQTKTGKNDLFMDTRNHHKMTNDEFVSRIENKDSAYNKDYYVKHDKSGKTPVSKPNKSKKDNLE